MQVIMSSSSVLFFKNSKNEFEINGFLDHLLIKKNIPPLNPEIEKLIKQFSKTKENENVVESNILLDLPEISLKDKDCKYKIPGVLKNYHQKYSEPRNFWICYKTDLDNCLKTITLDKYGQIIKPAKLKDVYVFLIKNQGSYITIDCREMVTVQEIKILELQEEIIVTSIRHSFRLLEENFPKNFKHLFGKLIEMSENQKILY